MANILSSYQELIKQNPLLTREQEIALAKKIKAGDVKARQKMIESNYRLVINLAKKYHENHRNIDFSELLSESQMGLIKAVDRFDYEKGFKFSTYACWWIKQAIMSFINDSYSVIKTPGNNRVILAKAQKLRKEYQTKFGTIPSNEEIASALGISSTTLNNVESSHVNVISIDAEVKNSKGQMSTRTRSVVETIEDEETGAEQTLINQEMRKILLDSMKLLSPREEKILRLRFGLYTAEDDIENFPMTITQLLELQSEEN
jgi:RNA polymerase primary sigma factor